MILKPSAVWFKSFGSACNNGLRQGMFSFGSGSTGKQFLAAGSV
jgi:hypothetical protein